jgi:hypothetical protein
MRAPSGFLEVPPAPLVSHQQADLKLPNNEIGQRRKQLASTIFSKTTKEKRAGKMPFGCAQGKPALRKPACLAGY